MNSLLNINKCNLAIFASGTGSNFINIYNHISNGKIFGKINLLISNNPGCKAVKFAKEKDINYKIINKTRFSNHISDIMLETLNYYNIDLIILAGYMKKIPKKVILTYPNRMLNNNSQSLAAS